MLTRNASVPAPSRSKATIAATAIIAAILVLTALYLFWWGPEAELDSRQACLDLRDYLTLKNGIRTTGGQAIGGVAVLIGLFFAWRNLRVTQDNLTVAQDNLNLSAEGQITDRFTRAIDQLGSAKLEIRLGGIYALERIATDSRRDYLQIVEILTAFIRTNAPWPPKSSTVFPARSADVQAILKVLRRRSRTLESQPRYTLDLSNTDLRGADLAGAHFEDADLARTHFEGAVLEKAHFQNANFRGACFGTNGTLESPKTVCSEAHFEGADFRQADLRNVIFQEAHLEGARLHEADLTGAWLLRAHLEGAHLTGAVGLTAMQIADAYGDQGTLLDDAIQKPQTWGAAGS
jgi:uncharacterized protein YjbI with pentapeptide repeats